MNIIRALRNRAQGGKGSSPDAGTTDQGQALTDRYERLNDRQAVEHLGGLDQVELTAIDAFERSHRDRPAVHDKLRYLRQREPLPGYDALEPDAIVQALSGADQATLKAVREYERKLRARPAVLKEVARALHRPRDDGTAADVDGVATAATEHEQPLVVGNGLPVKVGAAPKHDA